MRGNILRLIRPADVATLINVLLGFSAVLFASQNQIPSALGLVLLAVVLDGIDGFIARYAGNGVLGANLDSLADVISFGVAPAFVSYVFTHKDYVLFFSGLFLICGVLRLARFNVSGEKDGFEGIPITLAGLMVALFLLIEENPYLLSLLLLVLSILMVSTFEYPKIRDSKILGFLGILLALVLISFYFGNPGFLRLFSMVLFGSMVIYILSPLAKVLV
jgi:CDP-diacylglycerol--serine O-phosphatidyltransferase